MGYDMFSTQAIWGLLLGLYYLGYLNIVQGEHNMTYIIEAHPSTTLGHAWSHGSSTINDSLRVWTWQGDEANE